MPTMKPKVKVKRLLKPRAKSLESEDVRLLKKGYGELRMQFVELAGQHGALKARVEAVEGREVNDAVSFSTHKKLAERVDKQAGSIEDCETALGAHDDRLNELEAERETEGADAPGESVACRCVKGLEGRDPDCYVHGVSFDRSDRPSRSKTVAEVNGLSVDPRQTTLDQAIERAKAEDGGDLLADGASAPVEGDTQNAKVVE